MQLPLQNYENMLSFEQHKEGGNIIMADKKMFLSDSIQYDKDIEPYQFIKIFSGVGVLLFIFD